MPMIPIPRATAADAVITIAPYAGAPMGMARNNPQHELTDQQCWMVTDANLNDPGFIRRRGPLTEVASSGRSARRAIGMARTQDPHGAEQILVFAAKSLSSASEYYGIQNTTGVNAGGSTGVWPYNFSTAPYELFDSKDALGGGVFVGTAPTYDNPANSALALWRGGSKDDASGLALAGAFVQGATTISLSSAGSSCTPGHFVFNVSGQFVGVVKSVSGNTLTLEDKALQAGATSISVQVLRGVNPRVTTGRITCDVTTVEVNGGQTKFSAQGLGSGTWDIYTPDFTFIGRVSAVNSDAQLNLVANAAISLISAPYVAINSGGSYATLNSPLGFLNASFAGHQFYAKGNTLFFSDFGDPETVDLTADGNSLVFSADPIRAIVPTTNALVILTETQGFALTGAVGTTPDQWRGEPISTDGTICGMTAQPYQGGVVWVGSQGVWYFAGASPVNVVDALDGDYRTFMQGFTSSTMRAYCAIAKQHYLMFVEGGTTGVFSTTKGATVANVTRPTFVVNLNSGAQAIWQNVELRGSIIPPSSMNVTGSMLCMTTLEAGTPHVRVIDGERLFIGGGIDSWACEGGPGAGPDLYVETKKYDMGDPTRDKTFRLMLLNYFCLVGQMRMDTVPHLNTVGTTLTGPWPTQSIYTTVRNKFNARTQLLSVRIWQQDATVTDVVLSSWSFGFKWSRPGRA